MYVFIKREICFFIRASFKQEKKYKIVFDYFLKINNETKMVET
jgi:glycerol-3-phosphate O-acyltransferase